MLLRLIGICAVIVMLAGCASTPVMKTIQQHDPILDQKGGPILLVDVCNQIDVVGDDDYFVFNESKDVAHALTGEIVTYLQQNGVQVASSIVPFVCGALDVPGNPARKCAEKAGGTITELPKPYCIADEIANDSAYLNGLTTLSTYVYERKLIDVMKHYAKQKRFGKEFQEPVCAVNDDQLIEASNTIKAKTNAASILYVGLKGTRISGGKKFAQGLASITVGMATGIATAGLGTGVWVAIIPGHSTDWKYTTASLVDLESGKVVWSGWTSKQGNPLMPKDVANSKDISLLLKNMVLKEVPVDNKEKELKDTQLSSEAK
jgi:hypothetical protein